MIKTSLKAVFLLLSVGFLASCDNSADLPISSAISDANDAKVAISTLEQYNDTANTAWKELDQADSVKIADIGRLVLEISYAKGSISPKDFSDLQRLLSEAQAARPSVVDQFNNASLQKYDAITDTLTDRTLKMNAKLKLANKFKPIMGELAQSIDQDENSVIIKRVMYDDAAKKYNDYLNQKKSVILELDSSISAKPNRAYFDSSNPI